MRQPPGKRLNVTSATIPAMACGITLIKRFTYRGNNSEEFSNQYWLTGGTPSGPTAWRTLFDALVAEEKKLYDSTVTVVRGYGYPNDADGADSEWSVDMTISPNSPVAGTFTNSTGIKMFGDAASWVRWKTSRMNNGRAIYLRKYFHPAYSVSGGGDAVYATWRTAALAFGAKMYDGSFLDARAVTARGTVDTIISHDVSTYITTRTLKRRGKRPLTSE